MSNYPEGVTGLEYAIAGPQLERNGVHEDYCRNDDCTLFEEWADQEGTESWYDGQGNFRWTCERCNGEYDMDLPQPEEYSY